MPLIAKLINRQRFEVHFRPYKKSQIGRLIFTWQFAPAIRRLSGAEPLEQSSDCNSWNTLAIPCSAKESDWPEWVYYRGGHRVIKMLWQAKAFACWRVQVFRWPRRGGEGERGGLSRSQPFFGGTRLNEKRRQGKSAYTMLVSWARGCGEIVASSMPGLL